MVLGYQHDLVVRQIQIYWTFDSQISNKTLADYVYFYAFRFGLNWNSFYSVHRISICRYKEIVGKHNSNTSLHSYTGSGAIEFRKKKWRAEKIFVAVLVLLQAERER